MNTNRDLGMPSGCEVETAAFHEPVEALVPIHTPRSGMRTRLEDLKAKSLMKWHDAQGSLQHSMMEAKSSLSKSMTTARSSVQTSVNGQMSKMQDSMRTSPMKWAGIAAGSGFALGMLGRIVQWRNNQHRHMPDLVIIESSC